MIRLLWKEWHELKWYLIALALGPWLLGLLPSSKLGYDRSGIWSLDVLLLLLILAFWAGTRMPGEMRATRFGVGWLPIKRWKVWLVKFGPGFLVAALFPLWIHLVALYRVHPIRYGENETALMHVADNLAYALSLYTCTFAVSMFASSVVAILCAYVAAIYVVPAILLSGPIYAGVRESAIQVLLSGVALTVSFGVWTKGRSAGPVRKTGVTVVSAFSGLALGVLVLAFVGIISAGSFRAFRVELYKVAEYWAMSHHRDGSYHVPGTRELPSPDGRAFAYVCVFYDVETRGSRTAYTYRTGEIRIRDFRGTVAVLKQAWASPAAWLPDGSLLVVTGNKEGRPIALSEWDPRTGRLVHLARLPRIAFVIPDSTGDKIAVLASPRRGGGDDLWVLDRQSRRTKLLRPGLNMTWSGQSPPRWNGDRLIFYRNFRSGYWSIRADGADFKRVFPEARDG